MLVSSKTFPHGTKSSAVHMLVLRYGPRQVLVPLPKTFQELLSITRSVFGSAPGSTFVFETSDLNICQDVSVEIYPTAWEAIALTVSTVVVKDKVSVSTRGEEQGGVPFRNRTSLAPMRVRKTASGSSNEVTQSENSLNALASGYDDIPDSLPTDEFAEGELGSYDDDFDVPIVTPKGKGKSRVRIESDDEPEDGDEEGYVEAPPVTRPPASYRLRNAIEPSFSIAPPSPKQRVATPTRTVVRGPGGIRGILSPSRARSGLVKSLQPPELSDEEGETKPPAYQLTQVASDGSPRLGKTATDPSSPKESQNNDPAIQSKFKPQLKLQVAPALASTPAPAKDKLLITIRHPPTKKENKFKVKATHTIGRVLSSACVAFGLDHNGASLMLWTEEDGIEMTCPCENDSSMGSVAVDGAAFIIGLAK